MIKTFFNKYKELSLYLFFGILTTLVNIIVYWLLREFTQIDYLICNVVAWVLAVIFAYITNKTFVFESKSENLKTEMKKVSLFFVARFFSLGIDTGIMYIGITLLLLNEFLIKVFANIIVIMTNYVVSKLVIFKKTEKKV